MVISNSLKVNLFVTRDKISEDKPLNKAYGHEIPEIYLQVYIFQNAPGASHICLSFCPCVDDEIIPNDRGEIPFSLIFSTKGCMLQN